MRVLLLEDDPDDAMLLESALRGPASTGPQAAYTVVWQRTLAEAVATLATEPIDVAVADLTLPDSRGIETIAQLRAAAPQMALVVLTGQDDDTLAMDALRAGAQDYLVKGRISDPLLERSVRYAVERRLNEKQRELAEREVLQEQLRHSQRMEAVGRLAGGVAHDFNNLLTIIMGHAQLLAADNMDRVDARESVSEIHKAAERASRLTGQLLTFSRQQPTSARVLDLNALVVDLESSVLRLIGENISLKTSLGDALPHVKVDPGFIEQVLINLAVNARDSMPQGGTLLIQTSVAEVGEDVERLPSYLRPGQYVHVAVTDSGCGMTDAVQKRIFEPFFTTKELGRGTGLGLSMVYGIVKQADGYIWCTSVPNVGTRFDIYLPATNEALDDLHVAPFTPRTVTDGKILVVEDEPAVLAIVTRILSAGGYEVLKASSGAEAIALLLEQRQPVDLMITDMIMTDLSGREVALRTRELYPATAVIYMSGYTEDESIRGNSLGPNEAFLQKPFAGSDLLSLVGAMLSRQDALQDRP